MRSGFEGSSLYRWGLRFSLTLVLNLCPDNNKKKAVKERRMRLA